MQGTENPVHLSDTSTLKKVGFLTHLNFFYSTLLKRLKFKDA
jgi:hypothetical protein